MGWAKAGRAGLSQDSARLGKHNSVRGRGREVLVYRGYGRVNRVK